MFRGRGAYLIESCVIVPYFPNLYEIMKSDKEWGHLSLTWKALSCRLPKLGDRKHWAPFTWQGLDEAISGENISVGCKMWIPGVGRLMAVFWCYPKISQCTSQVVLVVKNLPASVGHIRCEFHPWVRKIPWRRKWQPILVYLLGEPHRQRRLVGYSPWGCKELEHDSAQRRYGSQRWTGWWQFSGASQKYHSASILAIVG